MLATSIDLHFSPEELVDYLECHLPGDRERDIEEHLNSCPQCLDLVRRAVAARCAMFEFTVRLSERRRAADKCHAADRSRSLMAI